MYQFFKHVVEVFIVVEVLWCRIMFYDCWWPLCQFIEVVDVENNFPLQIINCYIVE